MKINGFIRSRRTVVVAAGVTLLMAGGVAGSALASPSSWYHRHGNEQVNPADIAASQFDPNAKTTVEPLARDCTGSKLPTHNGFQQSPACVTTADGEVSAFANNPELVIVDSPRRIKEGRDFTLKVSTRNLVRDRFLGAGAGGYYLETSLLNAQGLTRGHFHTGCRVLAHRGRDVREAPVPDRSAFFVATEDGGGSATPDTVKITVKGKDANGKALFDKGDEVQCSTWAGDGSHRIPMMTFANSQPAFDSVRIQVRGR